MSLPAGSPRPRLFYGWVLIAVFWLIMVINLAFPMYGLSVLNPYMAGDLKLDRTTLGLVYAVFMTMTGVPGPLAAWCVGRFGIRVALIIGNALLALSAAAMATVVHSALSLVLVAGVAIGVSDALGGPIPAQAGVTRWFVRQRGLALAIVLSGAGIGGFLAPPLLDRMASSGAGAWRSGWWLIAGLAVIACGLAAVLVREHPGDVGQHPDGAPSESAVEAATSQSARLASRVFITAEDWSPGEALRSSTLWLMMLAALGFSAALVLFLAQGVSHMHDLGHSPATAAMALSVSVAAGLLANLAIGALGDRIEPRLLWVGCLILNALGMVMLLVARDVGVLMSSAVVLGVSGSGCMICMVTLMGNYYGPRAFAPVYGVVSAVQSTLGALAPLIAGYAYDRGGSYTPVFLAVALLCVVGAAILVVMRPPQRRASAPALAETNSASR